MKVRNINIEKFNKDKTKYYILNKIIKGDNSLIYSDDKSYIIGQSSPNLPIWIWHASNYDLEKLINDLDKLLVNDENKITCSQELYKKLQEKYKFKDYFEMGYLECSSLIKTQKKGIFVRPNYSDIVTLANYWIQNEKEIDNIDISMNDAIEEVNEWINSKNFYVLKDNKGKIVSIAGYSLMDDIAKITHVYTPKEERKKGYCKSLIYELTKKLLEDNYKVMLYTNYNYEPSNKAYIGVGFENKGILINTKIIKQG